MNTQEESPVRNACKESRRFTISRAGEGWPRADVPYLRMRGRWLERAGFAIGRNVKVEVSDGRLVIEPVE